MKIIKTIFLLILVPVLIGASVYLLGYKLIESGRLKGDPLRLVGGFILPLNAFLTQDPSKTPLLYRATFSESKLSLNSYFGCGRFVGNSNLDGVNYVDFYSPIAGDGALISLNSEVEVYKSKKLSELVPYPIDGLVSGDKICLSWLSEAEPGTTRFIKVLGIDRSIDGVLRYLVVFKK